MACRELLLRLKRRGLIQLPPGRSNPNTFRRNRSIPLPDETSTPLEGKLSQFGPPQLKMVRHTPLEPLYNSLIHHYQYLGYHEIVGAHLKPSSMARSLAASASAPQPRGPHAEIVSSDGLTPSKQKTSI